MVIRISNIKSSKLFFFLISVLLEWFLTEQMLLKFKGKLWVIYMLFDVGALLCLQKIWHRKKDILFEIMLVTVTVISVFRYISYRDINELLEVILLSVLFFLLNNTDKEYQKIFITASLFSMIADVGWACLRAIFIGGFAGNRVGIMVALFLTVLICIFSQRKALKYFVIIFGLVLLVLIQSRTSVLAFVCAALVSVFIDLKGKLTIKKMLLIIVVTLCIVWFATIEMEKVIALFFHKWGSASMDSVDMRFLFWTDIFNHNTFIGLAPDYMANKYRVSNCHNTFIQAYLQFGWIVFLFHFAWFARLLFMEIKVGIKQKSSWLPYLALYTVMSIMESVFMYDSTYSLVPITLIAVSGVVLGNTSPETKYVWGNIMN